MRAWEDKTAPAPAEKSLRVLACRLETAAKTGAFEHRHEASALPARSKDLASALPTHCTAPRAAIVSPAVLSSGRARLSAGEQFWQEVAHRRALPHERPTPFADRSAQPRASHIGAREAENEPASAHHETAGLCVWALRLSLLRNATAYNPTGRAQRQNASPAQRGPRREDIQATVFPRTVVCGR